ncbi:hypothetical protein ACFE04_026149 [Oxalis oulophora]
MAKTGETTPTLSTPHVSASQQGSSSTYIIKIASGEAEESLHDILGGSEEENDNGVNKSLSLYNKSPSKTTTSHSKTLTTITLQASSFQIRTINDEVSEEKVSQLDAYLGDAGGAPQTTKEVLALRQAIRESDALIPHELKV